MLGDKEAIATVAVKDIDAAKKFYEGTLGLKLLDTMGGEALTFQCGNSTIFVYRSQYARTNQATAATWVVGNDLEKLVEQLKGKGVSFEHYDMPGITRKGDIHFGGPVRNAWFKDPDGNIHALVSA